MKGSREIYLDYKRARQAAEKLEAIADDLERCGSRQMADTLEELSASWNCSASPAFRSKGETLKDHVNRTGKKLRQTAEEIRNEAWRIYQAEMRALEIATKRKS